MPGSCAWPLSARTWTRGSAAMRTICGARPSRRSSAMAAQVLLARAARGSRPMPTCKSDAPDLIASLLAGGFDREAARWARWSSDMDDEPADRCLGDAGARRARRPRGLDIERGRIEDFVDRDDSEGKQRTRAAGRRAGRAWPDRRRDRRAAQPATIGLGLGAQTGWTELIDGAMRAAAGGDGDCCWPRAGCRRRDFDEVPRASICSTRSTRCSRTGQEYLARMIAAEALART